MKSPQIGSFLPFFSIRALFFQRQILTCSDWPNHILKGTYGFVLMSRIYRLVLSFFFDTSFLKNRMSRAELFAQKSEPSLMLGSITSTYYICCRISDQILNRAAISGGSKEPLDFSNSSKEPLSWRCLC